MHKIKPSSFLISPCFLRINSTFLHLYAGLLVVFLLSFASCRNKKAQAFLNAYPQNIPSDARIVGLVNDGKNVYYSYKWKDSLIIQQLDLELKETKKFSFAVLRSKSNYSSMVCNGSIIYFGFHDSIYSGVDQFNFNTGSFQQDVYTFKWEDPIITTHLNVLENGSIIQCGKVNKRGVSNACAIIYKPGGSIYKVWNSSSPEMMLQSIYTPQKNILFFAYTYEAGNNNRNFLYIKTDTALNDQIRKVYGTMEYEEPHQAVLHPNGSIYWAGHTAGMGHSEHDGYIFRFQEDGNVQYEKTIGTAGHDGIQNLTILEDGAIVSAMRVTNGSSEDVQVNHWNANLELRQTLIFSSPNTFDNPDFITAFGQNYYIMASITDAGGVQQKVILRNEVLLNE